MLTLRGSLVASSLLVFVSFGEVCCNGVGAVESGVSAVPVWGAGGSDAVRAATEMVMEPRSVPSAAESVIV